MQNRAKENIKGDRILIINSTINYPGQMLYIHIVKIQCSEEKKCQRKILKYVCTTFFSSRIICDNYPKESVVLKFNISALKITSCLKLLLALHIKLFQLVYIIRPCLSCYTHVHVKSC